MRYGISLLLGGICAAIFWRADLSEHDGIQDFYVLVAMLAGTMLGFAMASLAILMSVSNTSLLNNLKKLGSYKKLIGGIFAAAVGMFLTMVISIALFFWVNKIGATITIGTFASALACMCYAGYDLFLVLKSLGKPEGNPDMLD